MKHNYQITQRRRAKLEKKYLIRKKQQKKDLSQTGLSCEPHNHVHKIKIIL